MPHLRPMLGQAHLKFAMVVVSDLTGTADGRLV